MRKRPSGGAFADAMRRRPRRGSWPALLDRDDLGFREAVERVDQAIDLFLLLGDVGVRIGVLRGEDVVDEADEGALARVGSVGDRQGLHVHLLPPDDPHTGRWRGVSKKPVGQFRVEDRTEKLQVFAGENERGGFTKQLAIVVGKAPPDRRARSTTISPR